MNRRQSLGGGARGFIPLKGKNVGVESPTYKGITSEEKGWAFSPTKSKIEKIPPLQTDQNNVIMNNKLSKAGVSMKNSFTLAEVLITLGIIGVVAAMTLPTLIQNHANKVVEARLMKFYSLMNQAILLAEVDYGDRLGWFAKYDDLEKDAQGRPVKGKTDREKWVNKYFAPYMKITETKYTFDGYPVFYLADGSSFRYTNQTTLIDWSFYTKDYFKCIGKDGWWGTNEGICMFRFIYEPRAPLDIDGWRYVGRDFGPYKYSWDGTLEGFKNNPIEPARGCNNDNQNLCTAYIQYNGWKIPDDYPVKVKY